MKCFDKAFYIGKHKREENAIFKIQRILRGHMQRHG